MEKYTHWIIIYILYDIIPFKTKQSIIDTSISNHLSRVSFQTNRMKLKTSFLHEAAYLTSTAQWLGG